LKVVTDRRASQKKFHICGPELEQVVDLICEGIGIHSLYCGAVKRMKRTQQDKNAIIVS
jgi:hypothetical protein